MQTEQNKLPTTFFRFVWYFLKERKIIVFIFVMLSFFAGFWGPINSILIKKIINSLPYAQAGDISVLILPGILIVLNFIVFDNFTWRGITYIHSKFTPLIINRIISSLLSHCFKKSHQFYQENLSGKISKQITNLSDGVDKLIYNISSNFLRGISLLITAFIAVYFVNPIFFFILVIWFILFTAVSIIMSKKLVLLSDMQADVESVVVGELVDSLSNHSNVRVFSGRLYEQSRINPFLHRYQKAYTATHFYSLIMHTIQGGLIAIMMACSCYFLIYLYGKKLITMGDFALILDLSMETGHMVWYTMSEYDEFNKIVGKCKQSLASLMMPLEIQDKVGAAILHCPRGKISFSHVQFNYKDTAPLFQDLSVEIQAGQKVGLVGYSGGGKSTFVNLILRFYDVNEGAIGVDDQDVRDVSQDSLRAKIAMIPQDPSLFHRSLMDNIRYGQINASNEAVVEAAKQAHAHEFIIKLPEGYNSLVGERGVKLSGGQRQRIAIARAILKNAPILILDEATSQLDSITEKMIQASLWALMQNKTVIVIAHRLSTLLHVDRILVFDKGKIVQDGNHRQLIVENGLYKQLWDAQVGGFLGGN